MRNSSRAFLAVLLLTGSLSEGSDYPVNTESAVAHPTENPDKKKKKYSFVLAPIPIVNPTIGNGLAVAALMLYKIDPKSPVSTTAIAAGYTDTESWGVGLMQDAKFAEDRWRILGGAAIAVARYELYVPDISPDFHFSTEQRLSGGLVQVLRQVVPDFYAGLRYMRAVAIFPRPEEAQPVIPEEGIEFNIGGVGAVAEWDSRNHSFQPNGGNRAVFRTNFSRETFGADLDYDTFSLAFNQYRTGFRDQDVFAWRASLCATTNDTPFFERCQFGASNDLRGYPVGRYYDDAMYAAQVEYRAPLWKRLGAVAFAGVGSVASSLGDLGSGETLAAGGVGLRILASKEQRLNVSIDWAIGRDESALYMYIGEAF
ncbi:MAG TPA: BamA/TamA family outer membrane protein [Steroidobacteraceae bacterium]|nr:BamA/TamA family outer membrane protein [Steroidobacteraceae bacterium]